MARKLKPVVYTTNSHGSGAQNTTQQILLLKAMKITQDPKKLREMIGVKTVAQVYRTLDKLALRREYHDALARYGIDFDYIVKGLKDTELNAKKPSDKIKIFQLFLKSMGLDDYKEGDGTSSGTWEEQLLKAVEQEKQKKEQLTEGSNSVNEYDVATPQIPERVKKAREEEHEMTKTLYD